MFFHEIEIDKSETVDFFRNNNVIDFFLKLKRLH